MKLSLIAGLLIVFFSAASVSAEVTETDVQKVVEKMYFGLITGTVSDKNYDGGGKQIVFIRGGNRYTLYYSGDSSGFLSVWVRPNGTSDPVKLKTCTDHNLDGKVDFGIGGGKAPYSVRKYFDSLVQDGVGGEFVEYWQKIYEQAIEAALAQ